jgi:lipopolysaccharide transport system ATP-binding protein
VSDFAISVENISKCYVIGHQRDSRDGLRHVIQDAVQNPWRWFQKQRAQTIATKEEFWALDDVSFEIKQGDTVGIIGRNGAGKSTLLKILSRITQPTKGRIRLNGRVASLLEVGTGFHQELSGRENIFLNGAILGMMRSEIRKRFDEIVAFAEVEKFLDTPVKRYSSGMYVRLAFAVAAHLEPEILIVDEVLAVGDVAFQKKCLGKMAQVAGGGRTVLFVSHNIGALRQLCTRAALLSEGKLAFFGDLSRAVEKYLSTDTQLRAHFKAINGRCKGKRGAIDEIKLKNANGDSAEFFSSAEDIVIEMAVNCFERIPACQLALRVTSEDGTVVFTTSNVDSKEGLEAIPSGRHRFECVIPRSLLSIGRYVITVCLCIPGIETIDGHHDIVSFQVFDGVNHATKFHDFRKGIVTPLIEWRHAVVG